MCHCMTMKITHSGAWRLRAGERLNSAAGRGECLAKCRGRSENDEVYTFQKARAPSGQLE